MVSTTPVQPADARIPNGTERHPAGQSPRHFAAADHTSTALPKRATHRPVVDDSGDVSARFEKFGLIGRSDAFRCMCEDVLRVSRFTNPPLPVLVTGETGVGKELVAKAIHACDIRRDIYGFVPVACAVLGAEMGTSQLFGHLKGSFSGAMYNHRGYFREADKGTIVLDDVEVLGLDVQPMILRVLDDGLVRPLGSTANCRVDVRVIATTNTSLAERIEWGEFRQDLYYRLCGCEIVIPPLRDRPEDIELQARYFLRCLQEPAGERVRDIHPDVLELFSHLPWHGNSRELKHVIWSALSRKKGGTMLEYTDLPPGIAAKRALVTSGHARTAYVQASEPATLTDTRQNAEIQRIRDALAKNNNNRLRAAAELGISRMGLYKKLRKYGLVAKKQPA